MDTAIQWYETAAQNGYQTANSQLGYIYSNGIGVDTNYAKAIEYYQIAADHGNKFALSNLGEMYEKGLGVSADLNTALEYVLRSAEADHPRARAILCRLYYEGELRNVVEASAWCSKSANEGNANSTFLAAQLMIQAEIDPEDVEAMLIKAIERGSSKAMVTLGFMHEIGDGVEENLETAATLYLEAAGAWKFSGHEQYRNLLPQRDCSAARYRPCHRTLQKSRDRQ